MLCENQGSQDVPINPLPLDSENDALGNLIPEPTLLTRQSAKEQANPTEQLFTLPQNPTLVIMEAPSLPMAAR